MRLWLIRGISLLCLAVLAPEPAVRAADQPQTAPRAGSRMVDLSGDHVPDEIVVTPTSADAAVLSVRIGRGGGSASLAIGWCQVCGPVYAVFHSGMRDGDDLMVFSPDRQSLRWMQWWGGKLIEQMAFPLKEEGRAVEALDEKTINIRMRNVDMMTISF